MSQAVLSQNLQKNSNGKCPKSPVRNFHAIRWFLCKLNHLKTNDILRLQLEDIFNTNQDIPAISFLCVQNEN